jgi:hypothetical protein
MLALLIAVICLVALLTLLVVGLLRSHADILRALHSLGVGVGDPAEAAGRAVLGWARSPSAHGTPAARAGGRRD